MSAHHNAGRIPWNKGRRWPMNALDALIRLGACEEARNWLGERTLERAWAECERGDWLLWLAARAGVDRRQVVLAVCDCAETAAPHWTLDTQLACVWAIDAARRWARGEADLDEVHATAAAADATAAAADATATAARNAALAYADAATAYATATATAAAADATATATAYATATATAAAAAATAAYADAAARAESLALSARLVRERISWPVVEAALGRGTH